MKKKVYTQYRIKIPMPNNIKKKKTQLKPKILLKIEDENDFIKEEFSLTDKSSVFLFIFHAIFSFNQIYM